jgi:hypothetical protein
MVLCMNYYSEGKNKMGNMRELEGTATKATI